jgi:uncharacterized membrane protein YdbT with pleckstrin-like domain
MTIHPSTRYLKIWYGVAALAAIAVAVANVSHPDRAAMLVWLYAAPVLILAVTIYAQLRRLLISLTIQGHTLRYQAGLFVRSTRTLDVRKVQDVRVDQSLFQRVLGTGDLSIETAGETSRLVIANIDRPHEIAHLILQAGGTPEN